LVDESRQLPIEDASQNVGQKLHGQAILQQSLPYPAVAKYLNRHIDRQHSSYYNRCIRDLAICFTNVHAACLLHSSTDHDSTLHPCVAETTQKLS
jgi:hypothetical protein